MDSVEIITSILPGPPRGLGTWTALAVATPEIIHLHASVHCPGGKARVALRYELQVEKRTHSSIWAKDIFPDIFTVEY